MKPEKDDPKKDNKTQSEEQGDFLVTEDGKPLMSEQGEPIETEPKQESTPKEQSNKK